MYYTNEFGRNELKDILETLLNRTKNKKQYWKLQNYFPILIKQEKLQRTILYYISQKIQVETNFRAHTLQLVMEEKIYLPNEKGDITGSLSYNSRYGMQLYTFGLSYDWEKYNLCSKDTLSKAFADSIVYQLNDTLMELILDDRKLEYTPFTWNHISIKQLEETKLYQLCENLAYQRKMLNFHRIIFNIEYRNRLLNDFSKKRNIDHCIIKKLKSPYTDILE